MRKIHKGMDYDHFSDSTYDQPECPYCGYPFIGIEPSDIGTAVKCPGCGKDVEIPDSGWLRQYIENFTGQMEEVTECLECGGKMIRLKAKYNGKWRILSGRCEKCGLRFIV